MPVLQKVIRMHWSYENRAYYEEKGYEFTDYKKPFKILVKDLNVNSAKQVIIKCDFCGAIVKKAYNRCLEVCNCSDKDCIKKRIELTNLKRYGVKHTFQAEKVKLKIVEVLKQKYNVERVSDIPKIKEKVFSTAKKRGNMPSSKQQNRLHRLFGGLLNYPFERYAIDVALIADKIAIEYNGSGHDLNVQKGRETIEEFTVREDARKSFLVEHGWKILIFTSSNDELANNFVLKRLYQWARKHFNLSVKIIEINFDKGLIFFDDYVTPVRKAINEVS